VGNEALLRQGKKKWRRHVADVVIQLTAALEPQEVVRGGGNAKKLKELPPNWRAGDNRNAFLSGFRLWEKLNEPRSMIPIPLSLTLNTEMSGKESEYDSTSSSDNKAPSVEAARMEGSQFS
jgi:hypothetical protein